MVGFCACFNIPAFSPPEKSMKQQRKKRFLLLLFSKKISFFFPIFLLSVTLVTAKNQHRCWKARAARTRARVLPSLLTSLFTFAWVTAW